MRIVLPQEWPRPSGYANGVLAKGRILFVAGQIGWDPVTQRIASRDLAEQTEQALRNVVAVLEAAGATPAHVVRLTWYVTERAEYLAARERIGRIYTGVFGRHYPAMSLVIVAGLLEPDARVEIEATAVIPDA